MKCISCGSENVVAIDEGVLIGENWEVYECDDCGMSFRLEIDKEELETER